MVREMGKTGQESETHALEFRSGVMEPPVVSQPEENRATECINERATGFPHGSKGENSACNADLGLIHGSGKFSEEWNGNPLRLFLPGESPWTEEPGRLQSMESKRVGHDRVTNRLSL